MCPLCLTTLAVTVATTTGAGAAATALAVRLTRILRQSQERHHDATKGTNP